MSVSRRGFLATSGAVGVALAVPAIHVAAKNKTYRTALIGSGWWGMNILRAAMAAGESETVALCDVDRSQLDKAAAEVERLAGKAPAKYGDYRELLEKEKPEIVIVGTPDHWHPLIMIAAVNAGAHVYVEKPIAHTVLEGWAMVKAARDNERVVQVGAHRRVSPHNVWAMQFLRDGKLGRVGMVRTFVHSGGSAGRPTPDSETPEGLDWNMWCGPAPMRPYNRAIHPKGFRNFLDYANGTLGDWGFHWLDHILWSTEETHPKMVASTGGRYISQDSSDVPDTQTVLYEFESFTATWEHRKYGGNNAEKHPLGCYFYGTEGTLHIGWRDGATFYPRRQSQEPTHVEPQLDQPDNQNIAALWADFLKCIKTGERPACDIEDGQRGTDMALLGMLSMKIGRSVRWDGVKGAILGDPEANTLLRRKYRAPWQYPEV
jgi:predicted dehydrogenase